MSDQIRDRSDRNRGIDCRDEWFAAYACDRGDVADEVEIQIVVEGGIDGVRRADKKERVTVGRRTHDRFGGDIAAGAWSIFDDDGLTEPFREPLSHQPRDDVGRSAGSESHD